MTTAPAPPLSHPRTLSEQVYHAVRSRIMDGTLAPGAFLREKDLEFLGVSRTPIREALGRLASEGFLERLPHRGFRVPEESLVGLLELYPIVASLELLAGRLALERFTPEDIAELREVNARLAEARDRGDVRAMLDLNTEFHRLISERGGNRRLAMLLDDLRSQLTRLELWYYSGRDRTQRSIREHEEIIAAVERGDRPRALALLEQNMALTYRSLLEE
ncbi:MAG TPA: GntR family transcriptional regulator, partial [Gemmatimonadales bacterium]|nr:GntR family transcriptional regulator [Gemmatimonadales bacterium]